MHGLAIHEPVIHGRVNPGSLIVRLVVLGLVVMAGLSGCVTPVQRIDKLAEQFGYERTIINSKNFQHIVYYNRPLIHLISKNQRKKPDSSVLHIYLEGDGVPWVRRQIVAADPTPRNPLALRLMAQDNQPSVYIGRPCYFGYSRSDACNPLLWTHERYAPIIVDSMIEVANKIITEQEIQRVRLIGYSGGGVLAMLMADRILKIKSLVTIAANLDIDAWAKYHKYSLLRGSLNPATQPPIKPDIRQWHLLGKEDKNVPPRLVQAVIDRQVGVTKKISFERFDHVCCWTERWPAILSTFR